MSNVWKGQIGTTPPLLNLKTVKKLDIFPEASLINTQLLEKSSKLKKADSINFELLY